MSAADTIRQAWIIIAATCGVFSSGLHARPAVLDATHRLYVDHAHNNIHLALPTLKGRDREVALLIGSYPIAAWFTGGTAKEVKESVRALAADATSKNQIPVLVAYNLPFRDCQQYSSGGSLNTTEYQHWIDSFAAGIGEHRAVVILEPDSLGIVPHFTLLSGKKDWCQPKQLDPSAADARFEQLNYAVKPLTQLPNTAVYLDGTHSNWLGVGDSAYRLFRAGVLRANGFFLNVSNYQPNPHLIRYGEWISKCIYYATKLKNSSPNDFAACASYQPGLDEDENKARAVNAWYANNVDARATPSTLAHFVIDTSRNGRGAWRAPLTKYSDAEAWCNPPGRGLGETPRVDNSHPLLDAKLWIKVPGESDGECKRGTQGPRDPERGQIDPPAGQWFKEQAAELIELAQPRIDR